MLNNKITEIHGHRGCRGYFPENTIQGFVHALGLNTDAIELDVVVSKDLEVVVSHEHFMHHKKCLWPNLKPILKEEETELILFQMKYDDIKHFDCGLIPHPSYPLVKTSNAYKPLLKDVIRTIELECKNTGRKAITYNIEIKSEPAMIELWQPDYELYIQIILETIAIYNIENRVIIQSFDKEILKTIFKLNKKIPLSLLIEDNIDPNTHIKQLGFVPHILASDYLFLSPKIINNLQEQGIKVFAFTVNKKEDIQNMLIWGVDAIISDYPDVVAEHINFYKKPEK